MILFVKPPIIELPPRQILKYPPPVSPLVIIKFDSPPIIDELVEKQLIVLEHPPKMLELSEQQPKVLSAPPKIT